MLSYIRNALKQIRLVLKNYIKRGNLFFRNFHLFLLIFNIT